MTIEDAFTPRLGKIRDRGAAGGARLRKRATSTAKQLSRLGKRSKFSGKRIGRGGPSAMQANFTTRRYASVQQRRVIIKAHIAKPGKVVGTGAFSRHLNYLQRDGVERDGAGGELYTREGNVADGDAFASRSEHDRHQFRFIVSPEDSAALGDLKRYTRELMDIMERDLGTRLDWVAVDHHNTGRSHTHIVVRGKDVAKKDLIIAPDYIGRGFRERASTLATEWLGPRRKLEIMRQQYREVEQDRFTGIDRQLASLEQDHQIQVETAAKSRDRFSRDLQLQRLKHLQSLKLAEPTSPSVWNMQPGWTDALKTMGKRGDIIKAIAAGLEPGQVPQGVRFMEERTAKSGPLIGVVHRRGPSDELRDTRYLLVRDFEGNIWHAETSALKDGPMPPRGAIVELTRAVAKPRQSDRTIARIAASADGIYSDEIHSHHDPSSSSAYRLAHKRRLEALRRVGIVDRFRDGTWRISEDFLERVSTHEAARQTVRVKTQSWLSLERQVSAIGETWLDKQDPDQIARLSDSHARKAKKDRLQNLRERGVLAADRYTLSSEARSYLNQTELNAARAKFSNETGRKAIILQQGEAFEGIFERSLNLGQGRFAVVAKSKEFALVPWRREMDRYRGRNMIIEARKNGVTWQLPRHRKRGLAR